MNYTNNLPVTIEEEKQMDALNNSNIIGVSGNQYAPVDTTPRTVTNTSSVFSERTDEVSLSELFSVLQDVIQRIGSKVQDLHLANHYHQPPQEQASQTDLVQAVDTALENADWLYAKLSDVMDKNYNMNEIVEQGIADRVSSEVDAYFSHAFDITHFVDIDELVGEAVVDRLDDVVSDHIEEAVQEALRNATVTVSL